MKTIQVVGLKLACTDYQEATDWVMHRAASRNSVIAVEAANTHVAALNRHCDSFRKTMNKFDLIVPDGMPLVWAMNAQLETDDRLTDRVYGPTLMLEVLRVSAEHPGCSHFFLGGKPNTLRKLVKRFAVEYPDTVIAGTYSPPFGSWREDEFDRIKTKIQNSKASLIWVCFGCPKQERWIAEHKEQLPAGVYFGIGAAFAYHAGEVSQAPALLQKRGLEWAYRLAMEPRRLFKRYLVYNSLFVYYLIRDKLTFKSGFLGIGPKR